MWLAAARIKVAKALGRQEVTVRRSGLTISCGTGDGQGSFCAVAGPDYEPELRWLLSQLRPGDTFVDVGANVGIYSLHVARILNHFGAVFALEPSPDAIKILKKNVALNSFGDLVIPIHAAASCRPGQLYLAGDPAKWNSLQLHGHPPGIPIRVTTVDTVLAGSDKRENFSFIKIDAEGVEFDVLEGAQDSIRSTWPKIIFENSINRSNELPTTWLHRQGYAIYAIDHHARLMEMSPSDYGRHTNLIAIHPRSRSN
jgi:FkbM family methyltransferase